MPIFPFFDEICSEKGTVDIAPAATSSLRKPLQTNLFVISLSFLSFQIVNIMKFSALALLALAVPAHSAMFFNRVSTHLVCTQDDPTCNTDTETSAEIVDVTPDGNTAIFSDSPGERLGLVDISNLASPTADGVIDVGGEPTSVAIPPIGGFVVTCINTSPDFVNPSGMMKVFDLSDNSMTVEIDIGGQPDAVAISDDSRFIVIAMENERNEDIDVDGVEGGLPQLPAGFVWVIDTTGDYASDANWVITKVELTNLPGVLYPTDPEPEFVHINSANEAVVTLQENNALVTIDLATASVISSFTAGSVSLTQIDTVEEDIIDQTSSQDDRLREPDAVTWINDEYFVTADEGDLDGGSRTITMYMKDGTAVWNSGNELEHLAVKYGHYPEGRSENKGMF